MEYRTFDATNGEACYTGYSLDDALHAALISMGRTGHPQEIKEVLPPWMSTGLHIVVTLYNAPEIKGDNDV